jgi:hypothetical protein
VFPLIRRVRVSRAAGVLFVVLLVSACGDEVAIFALTFQLSVHGAIAVALLQIAGLVPGIILGRLVGASLVGRPPGRVLAVASAGQAVIAAGIAATPPPGVVIGLVALLSAVNVVGLTALNSALPQLSEMPAERAYAIGQAGPSLAMLLGPIGGIELYTLLGQRGALAVDAISFLAVAYYGLARWGLPAGSDQDEGEDEAVVRGRITPRLMLMVGAILIVIAATAGSDIAFIFLIRQHIPHDAVPAYGLATAAWAVGILAGSAIAASFRGPSAKQLFAAGGLIGLVYASCGLMPTMAFLIAAFVLGGAANGVFNATLRATIYNIAGPRLAPRAFGIFMVGANSAVLGGMLIVTPFAARHSASVYLVGGLAAVAASGAAALVTRTHAAEVPVASSAKTG